MSCRNHPDLERALQHERDRVKRMAEALDRYGRHEKGCRFTRTHARCECTCGLHERIREGGVRP